MESVEEKMKGTVIYKCKLFLRDKPDLCKMMCDDRQWKNKERVVGGGGGGNKRPSMMLLGAPNANAMGGGPMMQQPLSDPDGGNKGRNQPVPVHFPTSHNQGGISAAWNHIIVPLQQCPQEPQYDSASIITSSQQVSSSQYPNHNMSMNHPSSSPTMNHPSFAMGMRMSPIPHHTSQYHYQDIMNNNMTSMAPQNHAMIPMMQNNGSAKPMTTAMNVHSMIQTHQQYTSVNGTLVPHLSQQQQQQQFLYNNNPGSNSAPPDMGSSSMPTSSFAGGQYQGQETGMVQSSQYQEQCYYPPSQGTAQHEHEDYNAELTIKYRLQELKQQRDSLQGMQGDNNFYQ